MTKNLEKLELSSMHTHNESELELDTNLQISIFKIEP